MKLQTVFSACNHIIKTKLKNSPEAKTYTEDGEVVSCKQLSEELENLESWCYRGEFEVKKITRCKNCKHYKRYKKRTEKRTLLMMACEIDKHKRDPEYYCLYGEER